MRAVRQAWMDVTGSADAAGAALAPGLLTTTATTTSKTTGKKTGS